MSKARQIPDDARRRQFEAADPAASVFVSANAGSGKTHVLVQRVINLLLQGVDPSTILCITYTKAAAANMSGRVFDTLAAWTTLDDGALDDAIRQSSSVTPNAATRARARRLFAQALETPGGLKVQTIHAFCTRLLHQFPFEADVAARFTVMDDAQTLQLLNQLTMDVLLEAAAAPDSEIGRALAAAIGFAADQTLKDVIADAIRRRETLNAWFDRAGGFDAAIDELSGALGVAPGDTLQAIENEYLSGSLIDAGQWPDVAALFASGSANDQKLGRALGLAQTMRGRDRVEQYRGVFLTGALAPRKTLLTKKLAEAYPDWNALLYAEQARIVALLAREHAVAARDRTRAMLTIAREVIGRYRRDKDRRALLDYDDLIGKVAHLFSNTAAAWVLYKLDAGIDHVLIDEAQDTSPKQWDIIRIIVSEFTPGGARANTRRTMFAVGDEKQSIFSFQGAAPHEFETMRRLFERQFTAAEMQWRSVRLEHSFRSGASVLGAVDQVYREETIFRSITADIVPEHKSLPGVAPGLVEIWPLIAPPEKREIEGWDAPFDTVSEQSPSVQLARRIAATVRAWMKAGTRPGEVLILVRQRNALFEAVIRALKQDGVPVAGADRLVLTEHIAVMDLLVLADALLMPDDDLALATVLKSPLFNVDEEQLFDLAWNRKTSLRQTLRNKANEGACEDPMFAAAARALDELEAASRAMSPFAFYAHVLGARRGRRSILARLGPEAADALDEFLNLALDYEARETPSLQGFVHWLRAAQSEIKRDMELARDEVRVMTVHGAKGLEANNVILADTIGKPSGPRDPRLLTLPLPNAAPGATATVWATAKAADTEAMGTARGGAQNDAQDEYRRLLYVAMTRAAERLVVCGARGGREPPEGCWYQLVEAALKADSVTEPADAGDGEVLRFYKGKPPAKTAAAAAAVATPEPAAASVPPAWLTAAAASEAPQRRPVTPSASDSAPAIRPSSVGDASRKLALLRGTLIHRLLQSLPDIAPERRDETAHTFLARAAKDLAQADRDAMAAQALRLIGDARFAALFAAGSRAEVPIVGRIVRPGLPALAVSGQVDRLAITADDILIADYKSNRPAPRTPDEALSRFPSYAAQLALYRAALAQLYPGKRVRAALIWTDVPDFMELSSEALDLALARVTSA
jgi:ATP-dependent helicase/nuclease subunit A